LFHVRLAKNLLPGAPRDETYDAKCSAHRAWAYSTIVGVFPPTSRGTAIAWTLEGPADWFGQFLVTPLGPARTCGAIPPTPLGRGRTFHNLRLRRFVQLRSRRAARPCGGNSNETPPASFPPPTPVDKSDDAAKKTAARRKHLNLILYICNRLIAAAALPIRTHVGGRCPERSHVPPTIGSAGSRRVTMLRRCDACDRRGCRRDARRRPRGLFMIMSLYTSICGTELET